MEFKLTFTWTSAHADNFIRKAVSGLLKAARPLLPDFPTPHV